MEIDRVHRFLHKQKKKPPWSFADAPDPRQAGKVVHAMEHVHNALWLGLVSNEPSLRDVERMTGQIGSWGRSLVPAPISDTTLDTEARRLNEAYLSHKLCAQVREMKRSKMLSPVGLPCGVATLDGKNLATLDHDAGGRAQRRSSDNAKWVQAGREQTGKPYYLAPALRAVLTSAEAKPALAQLPLGPKQGESAAFPELVETLHRDYGRSALIDVIDADAGLTSLKNADAVNALGYGYVFGLKSSPQRELFAEAQALLEPKARREQPEAETPWERRGARRIRRRLWRTAEMQGIQNSVGTWSHLRQTWLVRQETTLDDGTVVELEDRYFISSLLWNYLKPRQILMLVRNHWGIENDAFNSLDLQWREDLGRWCTHGDAVWGLGLLRLMAYNVTQYLRKRRLRRKDERGAWRSPVSWRALFRLLRTMLDTASVEPRMTTVGG